MKHEARTKYTEALPTLNEGENQTLLMERLNAVTNDNQFWTLITRSTKNILRIRDHVSLPFSLFFEVPDLIETVQSPCQYVYYIIRSNNKVFNFITVKYSLQKCNEFTLKIAIHRSRSPMC